jgi:hypothetical protein
MLDCTRIESGSGAHTVRRHFAGTDEPEKILIYVKALALKAYKAK